MGFMEKLKLLFKARKPATDIINQVREIKTGFKSWQFWASFCLSSGALVASLQGMIPLEVSLYATAGLTFFYNLFRGAKKADVVGVRPYFLSSEFFMSTLGYLQTGLLAIQTGGIDEKWIMVALGVITAATGAGQNLAAQQPTKPVDAVKMEVK